MAPSIRSLYIFQERTIIVNYVSTSALLRDVNNSTLFLILRVAKISFGNFTLQEKFDQLINDDII